jgi:phosphoglycerate dehydrogenase-like enzyme
VGDTLEIAVIGAGEHIDGTVQIADLTQINDFDVLYVRDFTAPIGQHLDHTGRVQWIHAGSIGVDHILDRASPWLPSRALTNSSGVFDDDIAEWVVAALLLHAKDLRTTIANQHRQIWSHRETTSLRDSSALVIGVGGVGTAIAARLTALGVTAHGIATRRRPSAGTPFLTIDSLDNSASLLGCVDHIVVALPLTPTSDGLIGTSLFERLDRRPTFVNVGRGRTVDEAALITALDSGRISFAALDVFAVEPLPPDSPLWRHPSVVVSPHMSGDATGWQRRLDELFLANLDRRLAGRALRNDITPTSHTEGTPLT